MDSPDATEIAGINEQVQAWAAPGDEVFPVQIDRVTVADDAIDALVQEVRELSAGKRVLALVDQIPMQRGGDDLKALLEHALAGVCELDLRRLPDGTTGGLHAELGIAQRLADDLGMQAGDFGAVLSIGSGTVTDLAKYARHLHADKTGRKLPFICFPTAASVTAYTSALAVLTVDGVKRTLPSLAPDVVICDLRTLADAPRIMTQAGFGDVLARSVSYGDWFLANELGMDRGFSLVPGKLLEQAEVKMIHQAAGIPEGIASAVEAVTNALLLSGMAMSIVRQTAPLSGWEHAISHYFDLTAAADGRKQALHGGQVGVATLVSARAYESAWSNLDLERLDDERNDAHYREKLDRAFASYDTTGALLDELRSDLNKKLTRWRAAGDARQRFIERKRAGDYDDVMARLVRPVAVIDRTLREAGAPRRFCDLDEPIGADRAASAVRFAHLIRARFTLGDLLSNCGWLDDNAGDLVHDMI